MASFFFDSSAIVKRYVIEQGTTWVQQLTDPSAGHRIDAVQVTGAEVVSALVRRIPPLAPPDLARVLADFKSDWLHQYQRLLVNDTIVSQAMQLTERYRLRGYDSIQLAAGQELLTAHLAAGVPAPTFVSADAQLHAAALAEGLRVDDPNSHP